MKIPFKLVPFLVSASCAMNDPEGTSNCTLEPNLGVLEVRDGNPLASVDVYASGAMRLALRLGSENYDRFLLELYPRQGSLGEIRPGVYEIVGPETDHRTCGICASVETDLHADESFSLTLAVDYFFARSGRLVIHDVRGRLVAELEDVELSTQQGTCTSLVQAISIDVALPSRT